MLVSRMLLSTRTVLVIGIVITSLSAGCGQDGATTPPIERPPPVERVAGVWSETRGLPEPLAEMGGSRMVAGSTLRGGFERPGLGE